jgi:hypothetical protein
MSPRVWFFMYVTVHGKRSLTQFWNPHILVGKFREIKARIVKWLGHLFRTNEPV